MRRHFITTATATTAAVVVLFTAAPANASIHKTKPKAWSCGIDQACTKKKRTMCVVTMERALKLDGKNYGRTGIWTAYWVKGHVGWKGCKKG